MQKRYRLKQKTDFARLSQQGQRFAHPLVLLVVVPQDPTLQLPHSRFAFSASRRVGNAVLRNRAKRLMREAIRQHFHAIQPYWDCLFVARPQTPTADFADVESAVLQLLRRAKLWQAVKSE